MNWTYCNTTYEEGRIEETPLPIGITFHSLGLILSALFGLLSIILSVYLMFMHATHYLRPTEQKHIIRILFMIPVYSIIAFISFTDYRHAVAWEVIESCYEAFVIASFFWLLCNYIAPDLHAQKDYFRGITPKPWIWPMNWVRKCCGGERRFIRTPRSGLTWFNVIWVCVFQYCFIRVVMTFVALITQLTGRYCLDSLSPLFAHVWVTVIEAIAVSIAMYCLIQFYYQIHEDISDHRPFIKVLSIKLVIFFSFWQTIIIGWLTSSGIVKPSDTIAMQDLKVGIPTMLLCLEMFFFSILHQWAYPWKDYDVSHRGLSHTAESGAGYGLEPSTAYQGGLLGMRAFAEALNPWDFVKAIARGFRWMFVGRKSRHEDISYKQTHVSNNVRLDDAGNKPSGTGLKGNGRYQALDDDDDAEGANLAPISSTSHLAPAPPQYGQASHSQASSLTPAHGPVQPNYSHPPYPDTVSGPDTYGSSTQYYYEPTMNSDPGPAGANSLQGDIAYHGAPHGSQGPWREMR